MNTKQSMLVCNVNFNDVTALVKDEKDNLICFLWKVSSLEMKFSLRVSMPLTPSLSCFFSFFRKWTFIFKQKSIWAFSSCFVFFFFWKSSVKEKKKKKKNPRCFIFQTQAHKYLSSVLLAILVTYVCAYCTWVVKHCMESGSTDTIVFWNHFTFAPWNMAVGNKWQQGMASFHFCIRHERFHSGRY